MRKLIIILWLALVSPAQAATIYVHNANPNITDHAFEATVQAVQTQLDTELEPVWGVHTVLKVGEAPDGAWRVEVNDRVDFFALGYHDFSDAPFAYVFNGDSEFNWQSTLSHEILEMVVDPWVDRIAKGSRLWLVEVADPVEADRFGKWVSVDGVPVLLSDFVYPSWYNGSCPCDAYGHVKRPTQLLPGGFAYYWSPVRQNWVPLKK